MISDNVEILQLFRAATVAPKHTHRDTDNISIKPEHGTSRAYTLDRLKRERPDLFDKVAAGDMSANAAAIEARFPGKNKDAAALTADTNGDGLRHVASLTASAPNVPRRHPGRNR
jgi:hypothetical protein